MSDKKASQIMQRLHTMLAAFSGGEPAPPAEEEAPPTEQSFKDYTLQDGTTVQIDRLEVGGSVQVDDGADSTKPAAAGAYTLADGTICEVDEYGVITAVTPPQAEPTPEAMAAQFSAMEESFSVKLSEHEGKAALELEAVKAEFAAHQKQTAEVLKEMAIAIESFMAAPSQEPIQKPKQFSTQERLNEQREKLLQRFKSL